jgi:glycosyltransferase involved in cell wall biosynthesis
LNGAASEPLENRRELATASNDSATATTSVIIPTFNRAEFLPTAVESARQAGSNLEIIVIDDGSSDDTAAVCGGLEGIRYLRLPCNQGLAAARNAGIRASAAEFIAFLDDDDLRLPGSIDLQVQALRTAPDAGLCYGRVLVADAKYRMPTGEVIPLDLPTGDIFWKLLEGFTLAPSSIVARRKTLLDCGLFREQLRRIEDWDLWLRVSERWPVICVNEPVGIYRRATSDSNQLCSDTAASARQMLSVQNDALRLPRAVTASYRKRRRARSRLLKVTYDDLMSQAVTAVLEGDHETARTKSREALRLRPLRGRVDLTRLRLAGSYQDIAVTSNGDLPEIDRIVKRNVKRG